MLSALTLLFPLIAEGAMDVHKCKDAKGVVIYTDQPCGKDTATMSMPNEPLKDAPVSWLCEAQLDKNEPKLLLPDLPDIQRQSYLASGYGEGFLRLSNARHFNVRGSFYLCDETKGKSAADLVEMVITPEGHLWMRRDGRVTHMAPPGSGERVPEIRPAEQ